MVARALSLPASIFPSLQPRGEETPRLHLFPSLQPHGVEAADRHATPPGRATIGTWFPCCPPPILAMTKDAGGKHLRDFPVASSDLVYSKGCRWKASARFRVVFFSTNAFPVVNPHIASAPAVLQSASISSSTSPTRVPSVLTHVPSILHLTEVEPLFLAYSFPWRCRSLTHELI